MNQMIAGPMLADQLRRGIEDCDICVFVATELAIESKWCLAEVGAFWGAGKPVIVFQDNTNLGDRDIPPQLQGCLKATNTSQVIDAVVKLRMFKPDENVPVSPLQVARVMDLVLADAKQPMFFASNDLADILSCNAQLADLLRTNCETLRAKPAVWLVDRLLTFVPHDRQPAFRKRQIEMRERFDSYESDYDFEDEFLDCSNHPRNNPRHGLWHLRIHAHRVRQGRRPLGFYVYYELESINEIPPLT